MFMLALYAQIEAGAAGCHDGLGTLCDFRSLAHGHDSSTLRAAVHRPCLAVTEGQAVITTPHPIRL